MSTPSSFLGTPGRATGLSLIPHRVVVFEPKSLPGGIIVDGTLSRDPGHAAHPEILRSGVLLGKVTASGKFAPSVLGVTELYDAPADTTFISVAPAQAAEILRRVGASGSLRFIGPGTDNGTSIHDEEKAFTSINTTTGLITLASTLAQNRAAGSLVTAADGSGDPMYFVGDPWGLKVTDGNGAGQDVELAQPLIGGFVRTSRIVNYPSAVPHLAKWIKAKLNRTATTSSGAAPFRFDDDD
jgi:hypothetical protein